MSKPTPMTETEINGIVREALMDAVDFVESEIAPDRIRSQRYFDGEVDIGEEEGRSTVVATKVRDTVRAIKPSLMRVFLSTDRAVEYVPAGPKDVQFAEMATKYMQYKFNELGGYRIINDAFHDALVKKVGIVKAYWDTYTDQEIYEYNDLNDQEYSVIVNEDGVDVLEHSVTQSMEIDPMGMQMEMPRHDLKISRSTERGDMCIESVPPEEFFVDRGAKRIEDSYVVAHRTQMRVSDVVAMGFDFEEVSELTGLSTADTTANEEEFERRGYDTAYTQENVQDPSMRLVAITEAYMKIDVDGTGVAQMQRCIMGGDDYQLLSVEPCSDVPFAVFEIDPEPHTFFGRSIADLLMNEQDASTMMLRGVLDNVALTNSPQREIVDGQVNIDDLLNNEIGGIVRTKAPGMVRDLAVPFVAGQTLVAIQYMDAEIESKTGVTKASSGLNPDAMQSTTAAAVNATIQAAAGQVEVMARNLAEGGMRRLFKLMLKLMVENVDEAVMMRMAGGQYQPVDPRYWNAKMDVTANVGLGTGREDQRSAALAQALQLQMQVYQGYGPNNGLVTMTNIRNTLADMLAVQGVRNADRYFSPMDEQREQQLQQQAAQQQQQPPVDQQAQAIIQAEQIKAQANKEVQMLKLQIDAQKAIAQDDRERDKMDQELLTDAAKIYGQYQTTVDVAGVKAAQAQPRYPQESPAQAVVGGRF
jgi:hypothetical protein